MSRSRVLQLLDGIDAASAEIRLLMNGDKPRDADTPKEAMPTATAVSLAKVRVGGLTGPEGEWGLRIANPPPRDRLTAGLEVMVKTKSGSEFPRTVARCIEYVEDDRFPYAVCITKKETPPEQWGDDVPF